VGGLLTAPFGPGVYEIRRRDTKRPVCFGIGGHCPARMSSLLPAPHGSGSRDNSRKRRYILRNLKQIEYRTCACRTRAEAAMIERRIRHDGRDWLYTT
jgi:hypothetical protein